MNALLASADKPLRAIFSLNGPCSKCIIPVIVLGKTKLEVACGGIGRGRAATLRLKFLVHDQPGADHGNSGPSGLFSPSLTGLA
jgi:hypothetical protein